MKAFENGINSDGSFRSRRVGIDTMTLSHVYSGLVTMSWWRFFGIIVLAYLVLSFFFALIYLLIDPVNLQGLKSTSGAGRFIEILFYSAQTMSTVGGVSIVPAGFSNNLILSIESLMALLYVAVVTGLFFVRFSRSTAKLIFSDKAVIAPYKDGSGLMIRLANAKKITAVEMYAHMFFVMYDPVQNKRNFKELGLEQMYLPLSSPTWTIVHPIREGSPFYQVDLAELKKSNFNLIVTIGAIDSVTGQSIFGGQAYAKEDIIPNARFTSCSELNEEGETVVYLDKIGNYKVIG